MAEAEDRTLPASPRRLQRAREQGQAAHSRDASMLASLGAAVLALAVLAPPEADRLGRVLPGFLAGAHRADPAVAALAAGKEVLLAAGPVVAAAALAGVAATLLQTGFLVHLEAARPDFARLDPRRGLKRLFGVQGVLEAAKSVGKLLLVAGLLWAALAGLAPGLGAALGWDGTHLLDGTFRGVLRVAFGLLAGQAAIAGIDFAVGRLRHARSLRMSRQELRDEHRESEGDPRIRNRIRQLRRSRAKRRMMAAVPTATVVVTNPTHYAVALAYDRGGGGAPRVVAKGVDEAAARIREVAAAHSVPLVANPPLARALYPLELDAEIPAEHFKAVAEIIAYVWRLRARPQAASPPAGAGAARPDGAAA